MIINLFYPYKSFLFLLMQLFTKRKVLYQAINYFAKTKNMNHFREDQTFIKLHKQYTEKGEFDKPIQNVHQVMLDHVKTHAQKGNLKSSIDAIDEFCAAHWMMNLGPEKSHIISEVFKKYQPKNILQIGGYCGYSSLVFTYLTQGQVHTIEIAQKFANIARQVHEFAGVKDHNHISIGTVQSLKKQIQQKGPYDAILIDHAKGLYLSDFKLLEEYGVIKKGTLVLGDNIIYPGSPDYLEHFKGRNDYDSTMYHSFVEYSNVPDAILVSEKL